MEHARSFRHQKKAESMNYRYRTCLPHQRRRKHCQYKHGGKFPDSMEKPMQVQDTHGTENRQDQKRTLHVLYLKH